MNVKNEIVKSNNTIPKRFLIKLYKPLYKSIIKSIDTPDFDYDEWVDNEDIYDKATRLIRLFSPLFTELSSFILYLILIKYDKNPELKVNLDLDTNNQTQTEKQTEKQKLALILIKEARLTLEGLDRLFNTPSLNDYMNFRMSYFITRFINFCKLYSEYDKML
jgi:hypothetical protein